MKALDLLLLSLAAGLTLLNAILLSSDYPRDFLPATEADPLAPHAAKGAYRGIVVHDLDHPHPGRGFPFHFVVGDGGSFPDGEVIATDRWRRQEGSVVEIALSPGHTEKQEKALLRLLARLRRDYRIASDSVGTHRELEPAAKCPFGVDAAALRE